MDCDAKGRLADSLGAARTPKGVWAPEVGPRAGHGHEVTMKARATGIPVGAR